ncbi:MAG: sugar ABC transporter permease [candidate division Zixibacteria bacterium]|nr:sugar ABC transporter permease [candidate division Zixibacteria bacterium]
MNHRQLAALGFSSPWIIAFLLLWLFPIGYSLVLSFTDYQLFRESHYIGLENYRNLFADSGFLQAMKNTFIFIGGTVPLTTVIALGLALLVHKPFRGRTLFRAGFFLPWLTSIVVIALVFSNLFQRGGYISLLAELINLTPPEHGFLYDYGTALYAIMGMDVWMSVGYYMLIFLAGLQAIPTELYEAAEIAGASRWRQFVSITLPLLRPVGLYIIVINTIKSFQVFTEIFVMTKGKFDTATLVYFIYETSLTTDFKFGYASAAAYILFLIIAVFSMIQFFLMRRGGQP